MLYDLGLIPHVQHSTMSTMSPGWIHSSNAHLTVLEARRMHAVRDQPVDVCVHQSHILPLWLVCATHAWNRNADALQEQHSMAHRLRTDTGKTHHPPSQSQTDLL